MDQYDMGSDPLEAMRLRAAAQTGQGEASRRGAMIRWPRELLAKVRYFVAYKRAERFERRRARIKNAHTERRRVS